ncbi:hypothetical protein ES703_78345 [subsurface metagenome]
MQNVAVVTDVAGNILPGYIQEQSLWLKATKSKS